MVKVRAPLLLNLLVGVRQGEPREHARRTHPEGAPGGDAQRACPEGAPGGGPWRARPEGRPGAHSCTCLFVFLCIHMVSFCFYYLFFVYIIIYVFYLLFFIFHLLYYVYLYIPCNAFFGPYCLLFVYLNN